MNDMHKGKKKVLFVDDETRILDGVRRIMRPMREQWDTLFAANGQEALDILGSQKIDVIVSDIRMPGMSGTELLTRVQAEHPEMVRIGLSGESEKSNIMPSVGVIHQYLSKPCEAEAIKAALTRSTALRSLLRADGIKKNIAKVKSLPSLPTIYLELNELLSEPETSIKEVEKVISKDMGMTTKVLQLVNSAFFGVRRHISKPGDAVKLLGLDTIKSLVLSMHVFSQFKDVALTGISLSKLWDHSLAVAACTKAIARKEIKDPRTIDHAYITALLHDVGILILASNLKKEYRLVHKLAHQKDISLPAAEGMMISTTHAEIGAYLLSLWGFSDLIVAAVAFHHHPIVTIADNFSALTAVHVSDALSHEIMDSDDGMAYESVNEEYLEEINVLDRLPKWREICEEVLSNQNEQTL